MRTSSNVIRLPWGVAVPALASLAGVFSTAVFALPGDESNVSYDVKSASWRFDAEQMVARNDVLYTAPATTKWHSMPVGGGDFSGMVRCDGDLHLHLSKSDCWNGSLGHVTVALGPRGKELAAQYFRQRLDLYHGKVVIELGEQQKDVRLEVWGHPLQPILIIEIQESDAALGSVSVELSQWRPSMNLCTTGTTIGAKEINSTPIGPSLADAGMQDYFDERTDPMLGRGNGVALGTLSVEPGLTKAAGKTAALTLPERRPASYALIVSAAVTQKGDPLSAAQDQLSTASSASLKTLKAEHEAWWRAYWAKSFMCLQSTDQQAVWLTAAYHVHLYTLACVNRGKYPASYGGGGLLIDQDSRDGHPMGDWVQEVRFNFSPLYAANRLEMARLLPDTFSRMVPYLERQTPKVWGINGLWVPETYLPWGHSQVVVLNDDGRKEDWLWKRRDPRTIPFGRFTFYNDHTAFIFTSGLEICHHFLSYYRYTRDEEFLQRQAYPFLRGVCAFISGLLRKEGDGRYHLDPANALETWWMVRDPLDTFDGIRVIFPEFIRLSGAYDLDAGLRARCEEVLGALPPPTIGKWYDDSRVDPEIDAYAPAGGKHDYKNRINCENPALYRLYPFGLTGIGSPDYERVRRTFEYRTSPLWWDWSMDAIWAARLGLKDEACLLLVEHARRYNTWPYGGWELCRGHTRPIPREGPSGPPFLDGGGCSATALQEILLQSHGGVIRVAPALSNLWSGIFQLRAEAGFLVSADVHQGRPRLVEIRSLAGRLCRIENPFEGKCVISQGTTRLREAGNGIVEFETQPGGVYLLESAARPASSYGVRSAEERFNVVRGYVHQGLPGRSD